MDREEDLRERLVSHMQRMRTLHDANVTAAFRAVPRHRFVPEQPLEAAYEDRALPLKESDGAVLSSISQPSMIAQMLELLDARSGARILEIGTGSGYNAALLATIAGPRGVVVTVELEADLAQRARTILDELGFHNVDVRTGNGETLPIHGMFDRIIVTAREDDIPLVWWDALGEGGRIVIPLDLPYGGERVVAFVRTGNRLLSIATQPCLFIGMREREGERSGDIFFRNASLRYNATPSAQAPLAIVGMRRADVQPDMLEEADVVVARPETFFAITHLTRA